MQGRWPVGLLIALAACSEPAPEEVPLDPDDATACALSGAEAFTPTCELERLAEGATPLLVVRHPDGSFRRFEVLPDGSVAAADGAEIALVKFEDDGVEATVGADRYRFPASVLTHDTSDESGT